MSQRTEFEALLTEYGNAAFDCGEYEFNSEKPIGEYTVLLAKSKLAKQRVIDYAFTILHEQAIQAGKETQAATEIPIVAPTRTVPVSVS